jgi:methionine-rich copper-binding protein CopC
MMHRCHILLCLCAVVFYAGVAAACPVLEHADPKVGSVVAQAPDQVTITFSSTIYPDKSTLEVADAGGATVSIGKAYGTPGSDTVITTKLRPSLPPGKYTVRWNVLCDCGSLTPGDYKFTVGKE